MAAQVTLKKTATLTGRGLHKGNATKVVFHPAPSGSGISIRNNGEAYKLTPGLVFDTQRGTSIRFGKSTVYTIEHMISSLRGSGVDNVIIEIEGDEPPVFDGSAAEYCRAIRKAGLQRQDKARKNLTLENPLVLKDNGRYMAILPYHCYKIIFFTDFSGRGIKPEEYTAEITPEIYAKETASARTFGFKDEIDGLIKNGLIKGADMSSAILLDNAKPVNTRLRYKNELTRHKVVDMIGDFGLLEGNLNMLVIAVKTGHKQNIEMVKKIIEQGKYLD